jgi:hypothetical protein
MNSRICSITIVASLAMFLAGCGSAPRGGPTAAPQAQDDHRNPAPEQTANFAKLNAEDRQLAEAQGYCAVTSEPLGSMGPPLKLMVDEPPVFVCCKGCEKKARSHPDKTLTKVAELKTKVKSESHN